MTRPESPRDVLEFNKTSRVASPEHDQSIILKLPTTMSRQEITHGTEQTEGKQSIQLLELASERAMQTNASSISQTNTLVYHTQTNLGLQNNSIRSPNLNSPLDTK